MDAVLQSKRVAYCKDLQIALQHILAKLEARPEVKMVILIGSYASGHCDLFTDLDLLVVMDTGKDFITRTTELYQDLRAGVDLDLLVYTPEEFERQREMRFLKHALQTGKVLYAK